MKEILFHILTLLARYLVRVKKPYIIGVTATAGKTTMTGCIFSMLSSSFPPHTVYISPYNYNGEYGLPLSILMAKNPGMNPLKWLYVFVIAITRFVRTYPKYLILEYGIDHPGEMDFLLSIAVPDLAIVGPISPNHIEQFGSFDLYQLEKLKLASAVGKVIVYDELKINNSQIIARYGYEPNSDIRVVSSKQCRDHIEAGITIAGETYHLDIPFFGIFQILNILPLFAIGNVLDIPHKHIIETISGLQAKEGRSRILQGYGNSIIIDGSYNGGFLAINEGLETLSHLDDGYRLYIVLGDMRELGTLSESLHRKLADSINSKFSHQKDCHIILVGPLMQEYVLPHLGVKTTPHSFLSSREAGKHIRKSLTQNEKNTIIYVKGSQNTIFLEEAIKEFLLNEGDISLLCRQASHWQKKKDIFFHSLEKSK